MSSPLIRIHTLLAACAFSASLVGCSGAKSAANAAPPAGASGSGSGSEDRGSGGGGSSGSGSDAALQTMIVGRIALDTSVDATASSAIASSKVYLQGHPDQPATVDADGKFALPIPAGIVAVESKLRLGDGELQVSIYALASSNATSLGAQKTGITITPNGATDVGSLGLKETGSFHGKGALAGVDDPIGILVYIPGTSFQAHTDHDGNYSISGVPEGTWTLRFEMDAFAATELTDQKILAKKTTEVATTVLGVSTGAKPSFKINNGASLIRSRTVEFEIDPGSALTMKLSTDSAFAGVDNVPVKRKASFTFEHVGSQKLYAWFADRDGLVTTLSATVDVEIFLPSEGDITINGGASTTDARAVQIAVNVPEHAAQLIICEQSDFSGCTWANATSSANVTLAGQGARIVHAKYRDADHIESDVHQASISVDVFGSVANALTVAGGAAHSNSRAVGIALTPPPHATRVVLCADAAFTGCVPAALSTNSFMFASDGDLTLYAKFFDADDQASDVAQKTIDIDTVAPSIAFSAPAANARVADTDSVPNYGGSCESGLTLSLSYNAGMTGPATVSCGSSFTFTPSFSGTSGVRTVTASQIDAAGNSTSVQRQIQYVSPKVVAKFGGPVMDVDVASNKAFVAKGAIGLEIYDVTTPATPALLGHVDLGANAQRVRVAGNYAYVAALDGGLKIVDVSDAAHPAVVKTVAVSGQAQDVQISGTYAYVASYNDHKILVVDISQPTQAAESNSLTTTGMTEGMAIASSYLYAANWSGELVIYDLSTPLFPVQTGQVSLGFGPSRVVVRGNYAFVNRGLYDKVDVVDVSDKTAPSKVTELSSIGITAGIEAAANGNTMFVCDSTAGLVVYDTTNKSSPSVLGTGYAAHGSCKSVTLVGTKAYLALDAGGLAIVNVSNAASPSLVAITGNALSTPNAIAISGNTAYVADANFGLKIVDVTTPAAPSLAGELAFAASAVGVTVTGNYAYLSRGVNGYAIVDVTTPASPVLKSATTTTNSTWDVAVSADQNTAYVADGTNGLRIVDISDKTAPSVLATQSLGGAAVEGVVLVDHYAYVLKNHDGIVAIDVANPASPSVVATRAFTFPGDNGDTTAYKLRFEGNRLVVAGNTVVYDITTRTNPVVSGSCNACGTDVAVQGTTGYSAAGTAVFAVDFGTSNSSVIYSFASPTLGARAVQVGANNVVLYGGYSTGLVVLGGMP